MLIICWQWFYNHLISKEDNIPNTERIFNELLDELKLLAKLEMKREKIPIPWPFYGIKYEKTANLFNELYNSSQNLVAISEAIANHVQLDNDETFCCFIFVTKRPEYLSEVMDPTPEPSSAITDPTPEPAYRMLSSNRFPFEEITAAAWPDIRYNKITEPEIMKAMIRKREEDKVKYSSK
jgi:hypothetical protein